MGLKISTISLEWGMFYRKTIKKLETWYSQKKRKPLILRGARQVGKSSLVQLFSSQKGLNLVEINFEVTQLESLDEKVINIEHIVRDIELSIGRKLNPESDIIFFDEIQKNAQALVSLRYFYEKKPDLAVIAAGSLLDFLLHDESISFPVGRVEFLYIGTVSFSEFLSATKQDLLVEEYDKNLKKVSLKAHKLLMEQYRLYCCVGGMPEAVQTYIDHNDLFMVRKAHNSIIQTYKADFLKYAKKHEIFRCDKIFDYVPTHLGQKIKYSEIDSNEKSRDLSRAIKTLLYAQVLLASYHTNATAVPLRAFIDETVYKLYFLDIGLSLSHTVEEFKNILNGDSVLSGPIAEQYVNQHIAHLHSENEPGLFYWLRDKSSSKAEIDLIYSLAQKIVPVEVKSNEPSNFKSLNVFMAEHPKLEQGVIISGQPFEQKNHSAVVALKEKTIKCSYNLTNLPLWAIEKIDEII